MTEDQPTIAEQRATERHQRGRDWIHHIRQQLHGQAQPAELTAADKELRRRTT